MSEKNSSSKTIIIAALVIGIAVLGFLFFSSQNDKPDLSIKVNDNGIEIDGNN